MWKKPKEGKAGPISYQNILLPAKMPEKPTTGFDCLWLPEYYHRKQLGSLLSECNELIAILTTIIKRTKEKSCG
jgi:hypothetical protein